jgi:NlpC/P60 family
VSSAAPATERFGNSRVDPKEIQRELMGDDLDLEKLLVYVRGKLAFDSIERVLDMRLTRTIEGASTVKVSLNDYDQTILTSGVLTQTLDINLDGLWFRLVKVEQEPGEDTLDLTFEDREIAILRTFNKVVYRHRSKVTRAEFILMLIREALPNIKVVIPELHKSQPIEKGTDVSTLNRPVSSAKGINPEINRQEPPENAPGGAAQRIGQLFVKGQIATPEQIKNANTILTVGSNMGARRKVLVVSIMVAIQESVLRNLPGGDRDSVGLFQQRSSWGSYADRHDPATAARMFFLAAIKQDKLEPGVPYYTLANDVQRSQYPNAYDRWRTEAERFVTAFGIAGGDIEGESAKHNNMGETGIDGPGDFYSRGIPGENRSWDKENSWECIQRLAAEVGWRAFFVSGVFYYLADDNLFQTQPIAHLDKASRGVEGIGFDYDQGKKSAVVKIPCRIGKWLAPPGAVVVLRNMGPVNGRWLVNQFERSLFDSKADVTLKKPLPRLPEPAHETDIPGSQDWGKQPPKNKPTGDPAQFGGLPRTDGSREAVVMVAEYAYAVEQKWHYNYEEIRPMPDSLWSESAHSRGLDCSAFATLVYKEAGCPNDPNGLNYNGSGYTGTLVRNGLPVSSPRPGDLVFYGGYASEPGHVAVYVGDGDVIELGSDKGILRVSINYRSDLIGVRSYLP